MATTAADVLFDTLIDWGVEVVFGLPGDGINGLMEGLRKRQEQIRFIHVRHEEAAAFMACAYAKYTGRLGVCIATSGPGGIHLLNGLYDAKLDGQPVLAITGLQFHDLINTHTQQDVELDKLFENVTVYNTRIMGPRHVEPVVDLACRTAFARRGVAHVTIPVDFQDMEVEARSRSKRNVPHHTSDVWAESANMPNDLDLRRAADILNQGKKVAILAGRGALGAAAELEEVAERLGAPIIKALLGKGAVADTSPYTTGAIGLLGTTGSQDAMEQCDTLLIAGSSFPYIEFMPEPGQARGVQIDIDGARIGLRYPVEAGLVGSCRKTLRGLLPLLRRNPNRAFLEQAQATMREWWSLMEARGTRDDVPMKPEVVAHHLGRLLAPDAIVSCDSGTSATWFARHIKAQPAMLLSLSGTLASMANGLPYAIAAQIAYPERQCVAIVGDGAFSMLMAEMSTAVKYQLPIKIIVLKNNSLGQIKWEQMVFLGNPEFGCDLADIDHAGVARACGATAYRIEDPGVCGHVLEQALGTPGPVVVEAVVDPNEPPIPARVQPEQALHFAESLARGTPHRGKIALTVLADKVRELI